MAEASVTSAGDRPAKADPLRANRIRGLAIAAIVLLLDQTVKWLVTNSSSCPTGARSTGCPSSGSNWVPNRRLDGLAHCGTARSSAGCWSASPPAIAVVVFVWLWREKRRDDVIALGAGARRRARQYPRSGAARLCRRLCRSAFRRVAAVFGLQSWRCCHYHRRPAIGGPGAVDARTEGPSGESLKCVS